MKMVVQNLGNHSLVRIILEYLWLYSWIIDSVHSDKISFEVLVHFPNTLPKMKFRPDSYNISYSVYLQSLSLTERISSYLAIWELNCEKRQFIQTREQKYSLDFYCSKIHRNHLLLNLKTNVLTKGKARVSMASSIFEALLGWHIIRITT